MLARAKLIKARGGSLKRYPASIRRCSPRFLSDLLLCGAAPSVTRVRVSQKNDDTKANGISEQRKYTGGATHARHRFDARLLVLCVLKRSFALVNGDRPREEEYLSREEETLK